MKALVTGASGFIGSTLIGELNRRGIEVYALLRKTSDTSLLNGLKYTRVEGDLSDFESLKRAVSGMDYVFHLAGVVTAPTRAQFFKHNAEGSERVARAIAEAAPGIKRFVYVSSLAAAGPACSVEQPKSEAQAAAPVSAYGESKLAAEKEVLKYKDRYPISIVRPPMVYGPRDKAIFVVIQTVSRRLMPIIQGRTPDGSKFYSLVHVDDLCDGLIRAAEADPAKVPSGEAFFISEDGVHSYRELLRTIAKTLGVRGFEVPVSPIVVRALAGIATGAGMVMKKTFPLNLDKMNEIAPDYWICSNQKARDLLGFTPKHNLSTGMADAIQWYRENRWL